MGQRDDVLRTLSKHREEIAAFGVESIAVFGSVARDEASPDSDVDLLVEFDRPVGFFKFFDLQQFLEDILGRRVDLVTRDALHPRLKDRILREAIRAA